MSPTWATTSGSGRVRTPIQSLLHLTTVNGLTVTGTDTGIGKTWVARALLQALHESGIRAGVYKPVCSGAETNDQGGTHWTDVEALASAVVPPAERDLVCPQCFHAPLSPPAAAAAEGRFVDEELLFTGLDRWSGHAELVVVEGAGGFYAPLTERLLFADFAARVGFPLVVVAADRLGTINHTLMTLDCARRRGLEVAAVVLCRSGPDDDGSHESNLEAIEQFGRPRLLATVGRGETVLMSRGQRLTGVDLRNVAIPDTNPTESD